MLNNIPETAATIWKFVHGLQTINFANRKITDDKASAIHEIIQAAEAIIKSKSELYELLNK